MSPQETTPGSPEDPLVLWLLPVPDLGGAARHVLDVARAGIPGHRLVVLCPEGEAAQALRGTGAEVRAGGFGTGAGVLSSVRTLRALVARLRPQAVHSHLAYADVVAFLATAPERLVARCLGTQAPLLVTTEHGIAPQDTAYQSSLARGLLMNALHRIRLAQTDATLAVSQSTRTVMGRKWQARGVQVTPNLTDNQRLRSLVAAARVPRPAGATRYLSLARLAPEKRIDLLLEAFAAVAAEDPGARLEIAGTGPEEQSLRRRAQQLGLAERITWSGAVEAAVAYGRSDVVVQLSEWENWSYTLLDAVVLGLPVVATDVGGNAEVLDGEVLALSGDRSEDVRRVSARLLQAREQAGTVVEHGTVQQMTQRIARAYAVAEQARRARSHRHRGQCARRRKRV